MKPHQLKGRSFLYKNSLVTVKDYYYLDGQLVILNEEGPEIKINRSIMETELEKFKPTNGVNRKLGAKQNLGPAKPSDDVAGKYYSTRDYGKFIFNLKNRPINFAHVNNLAASIKENDLLHSQPGLVNEKYEVIDGQHRLKAAEKERRPFYYIMKQGLTIDDAISLNINTKNWGYPDYLHHWISQGSEAYIYYKRFQERYNFSYTLSLSLLHSGTTATKSGTKRIFDNGEMEINFREKAEFIGRMTLLYSRHGAFANDRSFIRAMDMSYSNGYLDPWLLLKKMRLAPDKFRKCSDTDSYLQMMETLINYHNHGERIRLY